MTTATIKTTAEKEMAMMFHQIRQFLRRQVDGCGAGGCVVVAVAVGVVVVVLQAAATTAA